MNIQTVSGTTYLYTLIMGSLTNLLLVNPTPFLLTSVKFAAYDPISALLKITPGGVKNISPIQRHPPHLSGALLEAVSLCCFSLYLLQLLFWSLFG